MKSLRIAAAAAILFAAGTQAATVATTLTCTNITFSVGASYSVSGPCSLTNIGAATLSAAVSFGATGNLTGPYTLTVTGGTITGVITIPATFLTGSGTASATVTGGTGTYSGATGSFTSLTGSANLTGGTVSLSGSGTIVTGGPAGPPVPTITQVLDAGSYTAGIAQGSVFVVKGTALSPSGYTPFGFPLPPSSGGVSINFTPLTGGTGIPAYLIYLYNQGGVNQLAAVLPSTVAVGTYNVTVSSGGQTSAPVSVQVVAKKIAFITADGTGNGLAVVQNYISAAQLDVNRFTTGTVGGVTVSPLHPGQVGIAYTVGMGADPGPDNQASAGYNFLAHGVNVVTRFGGTVTATPVYAGRVAGGSGYEQINFTVPANVPTGCTVTFEVSEDGGTTWASPTFVAIAPDTTSSVCVQPGYTASDLAAFDNGTKVVYNGDFSMQQFTATEPGIGSVTFAAATGAFTKYTGSELGAIPLGIQTLLTNKSGCVVAQGQNGGSGVGAGINLDAGAVTLSGPSGSSLANVAFNEQVNSYSINPLPGGAKLVPGTYSINIAGGTDVGATSASVAIPSPVTVTGGLPAVVNRSAGLTLAWTGGNPSDLVEVLGGSGPSAALVTFVCITTAGQGGITVPSSILNQLPAVSAAANANGSGIGSLEVFSATNPGQFSAPLTAGGSIASTFAGLVGTGGQVSYQ